MINFKNNVQHCGCEGEASRVGGKGELEGGGGSRTTTH